MKLKLSKGKNNYLHHAKSDFFFYFQVLIKHNSLLSPNNEDEQSPIHLAAIHGRVDIVEELIKQESHLIMNEDENSNTPLHLACMNNKSRTAEVKLFLTFLKFNLSASSKMFWHNKKNNNEIFVTFK